MKYALKKKKIFCFLQNDDEKGENNQKKDCKWLLKVERESQKPLGNQK